MIENNLDSNDTRPTNVTTTHLAFSTIASAFQIFGLFLLITIAVSIPLALIQHFVDPRFKPLLNFLGYTISMSVLLLITILRRKSFSFLWKKTSILPILICIPLILSMGFIIEPVINLIPMPEIIQKLFKDMITVDTFSFITVVIAAPILEELVFRGIILDGMLQRYTPQKAIFWSSFIFGLVHLNPWQFIGAFAAGLIFGWVYFKTKSLWPCILMHLVNNLSGFLFLIFSKDTDGITFNLLKSSSGYLRLYLFCIPLFALCLYGINKALNRTS